MLDTLDPATRFAIAADRRADAQRRARDERLLRMLPHRRDRAEALTRMLRRLLPDRRSARRRTRHSAILAR